MAMLYVFLAGKRNRLKNWQTNVFSVESGYVRNVLHTGVKASLMDICVKHAKVKKNNIRNYFLINESKNNIYDNGA